jgi:hypothetical protein
MTLSYIEYILLAVIALFIQRPLIQLMREKKVDIKYIAFLFFWIGGGYFYLRGFQEDNYEFKKIYLILYIIIIYSLINFRSLKVPVIINPRDVKEWVITIMLFLIFILIFILLDFTTLS